MEKLNTKDLRKMRNELPNGYIADITGGDSAKRSALGRIFTKNKLTESEHEMLEKFLEYHEQYKQKMKALNERIHNQAQ